MRLTLRTLLAYMDGVLSPEEQEELKKQIDASELASELIHRTGDVVRRPQIGVPEVLGTGPVDDPNTMAEYLDGTLPDENVADFERACLDSEVMLSEAASAHHALKLVLSREGDVDLDTLKRMQWLPHILQEATQVRVEPPHPASEPEAAGAVESQSVENEPEVEGTPLPSYLREQRARQKNRAAWFRWAPAIASLLLLGTTAFLLFGPTKEADNSGVAIADEAGEQEVAAEEESVVAETSEGTDANPSEASVATEPGAMDATDPNQMNEADEPADSTEVLETETDVTVTPLSETEAIEEPNLDPSIVQNNDAEAIVPRGDSETAADTSTTEENVDAPEALPKEPTKLIFAGPETTLLVVETQPEVWSRVSVNEELPSGKRLVSMPTYRPSVMLGENLRAELVDYSEAIIDIDIVSVEAASGPTVSLEGVSADAVSAEATSAKTASEEMVEVESSIPSIDLSHGRLLLHNVSEDEEVKLSLIIDGARCNITIEPGLPLAIEADRKFSRGLDLLNQSPDLSARVYARGGNVTWEANGGIYKASQPKQWELTPQGEPNQPRDFVEDPGWIEGLNNNAWDRRASPQLPKRVVVQKEVWPQLREIVESDSYKEVRALAAHCSLAVGHPDILVASFDDETQQASWARNLEKLRVTASRSQVEASRIHRAMEEQYGEKLSADLFVMLCGFSNEEVGLTDEELQRGALLQLIDWLESDSLASRVFATLNLEQVTGRIAFYNPTDQSGRRRQDIRKIRKRLRENDLRLDSAVE